MKAIVLSAYGSADRLRLEEVDKPVAGPGEVLVRVRATSVNPYDWHIMRGQPRVARLMGELGLRRPPIEILGCDMAGQVEAVGAGVTGFRPGDEVFALLRGGGFGEYVTVPEDLLAPMPKNATYEQAAAVPMAGVTALVAVRDQGRARPGRKVLVNGASGGVGTFAVQLARVFGAKVAGVCSGRNAELVRSIGADEVIDYTAEDFTSCAQRYDVLIDVAGSRSPRETRRVVAPDGAIVLVGGPGGRWLQPVGHIAGLMAMGRLRPPRTALADAVRYAGKKRALGTLAGLIEEGKVTPVVDRRYPFEELPEAVRYVEAGHAPGKVVVTL